MTRTEYLQGVDFIKKNSGTKEEETWRLSEWEKHAKPLIYTTKQVIHKLVCKQAGKRV